MMRLQGRVLAIGGSDSGGGAGVGADLKTALALGAHAGCAITAVTVQDSRAVHAVHALPTALVVAQIRVFLEDPGADAIKCGMLVDAAMIEAVAGALGPDGAPLVLDPVLVASSGRALLAEDGIAALRLLMPRVALVTPNLPEAEALTGRNPATRAARLLAARDLIGLGAGAVLIKGGHDPGERLADLLVSGGGAVREFAHPRIETRHTHGTGCTLASAVAVGLAQGLALHEAVARAIGFVQAAIRTAPGLGLGSGPLNHAAWLEPRRD